jgi:hypothetical protein
MKQQLKEKGELRPREVGWIWVVRRVVLPFCIGACLCLFVVQSGGNPGTTVWQASISVGVYYTIQMNGAGLVHGWLFGAFIQALNVSYGVVTRQWGFVLSMLGMMGFLEVYAGKVRAARTAGRSGAR